MNPTPSLAIMRAYRIVDAGFAALGRADLTVADVVRLPLPCACGASRWRGEHHASWCDGRPVPPFRRQR